MKRLFIKASFLFKRIADFIMVMGRMFSIELKNTNGSHFFSRLIGLWHGFNTNSYLQYKKIDGTKLHEYLSDFQRWFYFNYFNGMYGILLGDKFLFYKFFYRFKAYLPQVHFRISKKAIFSIEDDLTENEASVNDLLNFVKKLKVLILKPTTGFGGRSIYKVEFTLNELKVNDKTITEAQFEQFITKLEGEYIITEFVVQSGYAHKIFANSVNTIRVLTMFDPESKKFWIGGLVQRFGTEKSKPVDNWTSGGICSNINKQSGILGKSHMFDGKVGMKEIDTHPDTGVKIAGEKIPNWEHIIKVLEDMTVFCGRCPNIGWDIAVTQDHFYILEANSSPDVHIIQIQEPLLRSKKNRDFYKKFKSKL